MSIFVARPRTVKPTRIAPKPATPFGAGILPGTNLPAVLESHLTAEGAVVLQEWPTVTEEGGRYTVLVYARGKATERLPFDALGDARAMVRHRTTPMPVEAAEAPARTPERFEPTAEDRAWWAQYTELAANGLAPVSGGAPEPECGVSGLWVMPGEDDDHEESSLGRWLEDACPDPEPVSAGFDPDMGGAFGAACDAEL